MTTKVSIEVLPQASTDIRVQQNYYVVKSGQELAKKWMVSVKTTIRSLSQFPERGALVPFQRLAGHSLRRITVSGFRNHLIFYEYLPGIRLVQVVSVLHGARDVESLIRGE
jgi:toxin ParE1/3/4